MKVDLEHIYKEMSFNEITYRTDEPKELGTFANV